VGEPDHTQLGNWETPFLPGGPEEPLLLAGPGRRWMRDTTMSATSCTPSCAVVVVARTGTTRTRVSRKAGSWLRKQVRMYSAIPRATAHPSVSRRSRMADSRSRSHSAADSSTGRMAPSEGGAQATWMGLNPRASREGFTSSAHLTTRSMLALRSARNSSTLASRSWSDASYSWSPWVRVANSSW
jgi:hypothetical protein